MARNPNTALENRHIFVAAKTGGGKSQCMRNLVVPKKGDPARVVLWDPDDDHQCDRFTDKRKFLVALAKADKAKKPFRIGWSGDSSKATFAWWCEAVWRILDGNFDTWIVTEELADLDMKNVVIPEYNTLSKRSRKYGGILVGNTQRIQEVPKTFVTQAAVLWIGQHEFQDADYIQKMTGLPRSKVETLKPLHFHRREAGEWQQITVPYIKYGKSGGKRNQFH